MLYFYFYFFQFLVLRVISYDWGLSLISMWNLNLKIVDCTWKMFESEIWKIALFHLLGTKDRAYLMISSEDFSI